MFFSLRFFDPNAVSSNQSSGQFLNFLLSSFCSGASLYISISFLFPTSLNCFILVFLLLLPFLFHFVSLKPHFCLHFCFLFLFPKYCFVTSSVWTWKSLVIFVILQNSLLLNFACLFVSQVNWMHNLPTRRCLSPQNYRKASFAAAPLLTLQPNSTTRKNIYHYRKNVGVFQWRHISHRLSIRKDFIIMVGYISIARHWHWRLNCDKIFHPTLLSLWYLSIYISR